MAHQIFISYAHEDASIAELVCAILEKNGVKCWMAHRDVVPGKEWAKSIIEAIESCNIFLLIFSENSDASTQVLREVERGVNKSKIIVPFRITNITPSKALEYYLSVPHWLDALTRPLEQHIDKLVTTILLLLGQSTPNVRKTKPIQIPYSKSSKVNFITGHPKRTIAFSSVIIGISLSVLVWFLLSGKKEHTDLGHGTSHLEKKQKISEIIPKKVDSGEAREESVRSGKERSLPDNQEQKALPTEKEQKEFAVIQEKASRMAEEEYSEDLATDMPPQEKEQGELRASNLEKKQKESGTTVEHGGQLEEDVYFARCNLKIIKGNYITWINWQATPAFIPAGTKLKVTKAGNRASMVNIETGSSYTLDIGADGDMFLEKFVTKKPVNISRFSADVQSSIRNTVARIGMTKEEVYIAMGPPTNVVNVRSNTKTYADIMGADLWVYARRRFGKNIGVAFDPATGSVKRTEGM